MARPSATSLVELRVLDGPNLYFTRPAVKVTLSVPDWLAADEPHVASAASRLGLPGAERGGVRPGGPGTEQRRRFVARIAAHVTRALAAAMGTNLAVRARTGAEPDQIVVAFPWRRRGAAEALGREVARTFAAALRAHRSLDRLCEEAAHRLRKVEPGPPSTVAEPTIPVIAVTGTNGKTTSVRLLAHLIRAAGRTVAFSSTDGVYVGDRLVEEGDYSGFGGAAKALAQAGVDIAVLETARGGILLRGIGTLHNDVALVTNVSADHLDLHGIRTIDQLAEVKSTIIRITRPDGWDVLNADDPRVLAMRRSARGRPWLFSLDADHPGLRQALTDGGRVTTVIDGAITVLSPGRSPRELVPLEDVPLTLAGISGHNIQNAMGVASAALGVGLPEEAVVKGLKTFVLDPESNPGRANLFELDGRIVLLDYAHNEAGMKGLVEIARGVRPPGGEIWVSFSTAGDRTDQILHDLAYTAARGVDHVAVAELEHYLRGRDRQDLVDKMRAGALDGGAADVPVFPDPLTALKEALAASRPGDVVAVTALIQRTEMFELLEERGASKVVPKRVRQLVRQAKREREREVKP
jgi:cyanophycin synthetase